MSAGKGSQPRPYSVPQEEFDRRHEAIFGARPAKERYIPPPLPDQNRAPSQDTDSTS
jgi:hypothetical protein